MALLSPAGCSLGFIPGVSGGFVLPLEVMGAMNGDGCLVARRLAVPVTDARKNSAAVTLA